MTDTPTMSLRVPDDGEIRSVLREVAKALREGRITASQLRSWLVGELGHARSLSLRMTALEARVNILESVCKSDGHDGHGKEG